MAVTAILVSDDQTLLTRQQEKLFASAPATLAGKIEIRGFGILNTNTLSEAVLALVVDLMPSPNIERMPDNSDRMTKLLGLDLPRLTLDASHPSACARLRAVLRQIEPR